jgi:hypothetical protein
MFGLRTAMGSSMKNRSARGEFDEYMEIQLLNKTTNAKPRAAA